LFESIHVIDDKSMLFCGTKRLKASVPSVPFTLYAQGYDVVARHKSEGLPSWTTRRLTLDGSGNPASSYYASASLLLEVRVRALSSTR
jgi:hypothetical protein